MPLAPRDPLRPQRIQVSARAGFFLVLGALSLSWAARALSDEGPVVHTLRRGDTVWGVAVRHGTDVAALERLNRLGDVRALPVGLRLVLPASVGGGDRPDSTLPLREALAEALWALRRARFEEAREAAQRARRVQREPAPGSAAASLSAQFELVSASVEVAFGRREAALAHLATALDLAPGLALDAATTSPKLVQLLDEAREGSGRVREHTP